MYNIKFYTAYIGHMSGYSKKVHKITLYIFQFRQYIINYTLLCTKYCLAFNVLAVTT